MIDSLYIGATGMQAQQLNVDTVSNNLANVNTPAYKKGRVSFQDLMYRELGSLGVETGQISNSQPFGSGVGLQQLGKLFQNGELKKTDSPMDIALSGNGFIEVILPDGSAAYTRNGSLQVTQDGLLATASGYPLRPAVAIPSDAKEIVIDATGKVTVTVPNEKAPVEVGQIELTSFINPAGLAPLGENLFVATEKAGQPMTALPGENDMAKISQGYLESSNVKLVEEMVSLILAQRAYEISAKVVQASDEMLGISNNLRR